MWGKSAVTSIDVPLKERNKLYAAMGRVIQAGIDGRRHIPGPVLARYAAEKSDPHKRFQMLKEFMLNTSCCHMTFTEEHKVTNKDYVKKERQWLTKYDLEARYSTLEKTVRDQLIEKLIGRTKPKPHPDYPKDKDMMLYNVFGQYVEGNDKTNSNSQRLEAHGDIEDADGARAMVEQMQKRAKAIKKSSDDEAETKPPKAKGKAKPPPSKASPTPKAKSSSKLNRSLPLAHELLIDVQSKKKEAATMIEKMRLHSCLTRIDESAIETVGNCLTIFGKYEQELAASLTRDEAVATEINVRLDADNLKNPLRLFAEEMKYLKTRSEKLDK